MAVRLFSGGVMPDDEHGSGFANAFLPSQLREAREADPATDLAEDEPCEDAESDVAKAVEDAAVILRRLHDVDGLRGDLVVLIVGHDLFLSFV
jgi:hypothetical protein